MYRTDGAKGRVLGLAVILSRFMINEGSQKQIINLNHLSTHVYEAVLGQWYVLVTS